MHSVVAETLTSGLAGAVTVASSVSNFIVSWLCIKLSFIYNVQQLEIKPPIKEEKMSPVFPESDGILKELSSIRSVANETNNDKERLAATELRLCEAAV